MPSATLRVASLSPATTGAGAGVCGVGGITRIDTTFDFVEPFEENFVLFSRASSLSSDRVEFRSPPLSFRLRE